MLGRQIAYVAAVGFSFVFFCFFQEWFSWVLLLGLLWLPVFSLLLSLPALLTVKVSLHCPLEVRRDVPARISLRVESPLPPPPAKSKVTLQNRLNGESFAGYPGEYVPTDHCGLVEISCHRLFVYDYLGLWRFPLKKSHHSRVYVLPKPIPAKLPPTRGQQAVTNWKPKRGGGFAENHDLRLYRPGDDLRSVHWKLSAKTGKLIYREALVPAQQMHLLQLTLSGTGEELDRKLGRLLWISQTLLEQGLPHEIRCTTAEGLLEFSVSDQKSQEDAIYTLLESKPTAGEHYPNPGDALWKCYIGGGEDA